MNMLIVDPMTTTSGAHRPMRSSSLRTRSPSMVAVKGWRTPRPGLVEEDHFVLEEESTRTRIRLWFDTPSVQARAYLAVDETVDQIATLMAETGRWDFPRARIVTSAMIWPLLATLKNWHEAGAHGSAAELLRDAVATLRDAAMEGTP